jgi:hypothetical protein
LIDHGTISIVEANREGSQMDFMTYVRTTREVSGDRVEGLGA